MSTLERGFKTWCERRSAALRKELGVPEDQPVDIFAVARRLQVSLLTPKDIDGLDEGYIDQLLKQDAGGWSAVTLDVHGQRIIIYNSAHSRRRVVSDIAHELAHLLLEHEGAKTVMSPSTPFLVRAYDAKQEDEANWLGWTILLPRVALLRARGKGMSVDEIAAKFEVSTQLVQFRVQRTGIDRQLKRRSY